MLIKLMIIFPSIFVLKFASASNELYCNFIQHIDGYNCEVLNSFKEKIAAVKGHHISNKSNTDVDVIFAPLRTNLTAFPSAACVHFENLVKFDITGSQVYELSRTIFYGCKRVQQVNIMYTKIKEFDDNLFCDLLTLETLTVNENSLEHLQRDLFKNNRQLRTLDLSFNKITSVASIIPESVMIVKLFNNPCADQFFYPADFKKIHELCPDENMRLSLNLTSTMSKFQEIHLQILKTSAKLDDFSSVADAALTELDERLDKVEKQQLTIEKQSKGLIGTSTDKSKEIELLESDIKGLIQAINKQNQEIENIKQEHEMSVERMNDQMSRLHQQMINSSKDHSSRFDSILERNALEADLSGDRKFIYLAFAMNGLLLAIFILFAFMKMNRPTKRDAMLLSAFDS